MSDTFENRKQEGFETFRPSEPETARYDDLKQPEVLTLEAIEREPWKAVAFEVPADASRELLVGIAVAANIIGNEYTREAGRVNRSGDRLSLRKGERGQGAPRPCKVPARRA